MESWLQCWSLVPLLCSLLIQCSAGTAGDRKNGTLSLNVEEKNSNKESVAGILHSLLQKGVLDVEKASARILRSGGEDSFIDHKSWGSRKFKKSPKKLPAQSVASTEGPVSSEGPTGQAKAVFSMESSMNNHSAGIKEENNESLACVGCGGKTYNEKPPSRSLLSEHSVDHVESVTSLVWPVGQETIDLDFRKSAVKGDRPSVTESQEDSGSGDPHVKSPSSQVTRSGSEMDLRDFLDMETSTPSQTSSTSNITPLIPSTEKAISPDSAEIDHLLQVSRETVLQPPSSSDGYEDVGIEDDDEDDDIEEVDDDDDITARGVGDIPKTATLTPKIQTTVVDTEPTGRQDVFFHEELPPKFYPDIIRELTHTWSGTHENGTECRNGYVRRNNSCKSLCDIYPTYCYNGGQCYIVENTGAFCRCNTQDYIWHKGLRCESIITDFQVMCVAVGTAALVVLLLFMMTVFFAKKLYLLKTENYKLRKRNRYRTPSELHNDNFSLSTIAEGSHPNVRKLCDTPSKLSPHVRAMAYYDNVICQEDPNAPQKMQDLPKACLKDEEPFNIQNSLSPKHESGKGDPDIVDVNCVLNNLT
ncbi:chondroitin sulfate proteoglycan 5 isoform X8 [Rhinoderma darwinii]|uniref:chondroitin sulfate proteoglycan 5 isoform X8 n=1 Tax=Rhinoderma darwinii TaxID=43563 RepID=UPI003F6820A7